MNDAVALIEELTLSGVVLRRNGDRLKISGPEAVVDDTLLERIRPLKAELLTLLDAPAAVWPTEDWKALYDERAGIAEHDHGMTRAEAEAHAFEACVVEWRNRHPSQSDPGQCAWCGQTEDERGVVVPFGVGTSMWLHHACWSPWFADRRKCAVDALAEMGITLSDRSFL